MKKSLLFGCAALAALALGLFVACGGNGDPTSPPTNPPAPITAKSVNLAVTTGDTAFKVAATGGALASGLKVYIADDGTAIRITKAASVTDYTEATTVSQSGGVIVVTGLTMSSSGSGTDTLDSDATPIPVTLAADAQTSQVSAISGVSKVPFVPSDATYTVVDSESYTSNEVFLDGYMVKVGNGAGGTTDTPVDPDIDREAVTLLQSLQATDTFTIGSGVPSAVVFTVAPVSTTAFNTILGFDVPAISLAEDFILTGSTAIPTTTALTIAATKTLTIDAGVILTLDGGSIVLTKDVSAPAKIVFAGAGATLSTGTNGGTGLGAAAGVFAASGSTDQNVIPVSSFTELTITGGDDSLDSIVYTSGSDPYITGPKSAGGNNATLSADTDCVT